MDNEDYAATMTTPPDEELLDRFYKALAAMKYERCARCRVALLKHVQRPRGHSFILSPEDADPEEMN